MEPRYGVVYAWIERALGGNEMYREAAAELEAGIMWPVGRRSCWR